MSDWNNAVLALEDGSVFRGRAFGVTTTITGEAVFNTSLTGYQEILTDPSYYKQIVTMTAPHIGNYGIAAEDSEHSKPLLSGFVVYERSQVTSNWRSEDDLHNFLNKNNIPGIEGVDTRAITLKIRSAGALKACLSTENISDAEAVERARAWEGLENIDIIKEISCKEPYKLQYSEESTQPFTVEGTTMYPDAPNRDPFHVVAFDFGAKQSIFKNLARSGFDVTVVPASTTADEVRAMKPDGIFLSNGPGDPAAISYAHDTVRELLNDYPIFGICMGHQVLTHALGAKTYKLKFGHRGGNQPVKNHETGHVAITAQNHGYASEAKDLEALDIIPTEFNLNDNTVAGIRHKHLPLFSVQYHPEAAPGPNDANHLFDHFYELISASGCESELPLA